MSPIVSEETPLLSNPENESDEAYNRFTTRQKYTVLAIVSFVAFLSCTLYISRYLRRDYRCDARS